MYSTAHLLASPSLAGAQSFLQQTWGLFPSMSVGHSFLFLSQGSVDDAEGHQVGIRSQGCSEQGKVWDPAWQAQHSWAAQLPPAAGGKS